MSKIRVSLIIEPEDGAAPILAAVEEARERVDIVIFRFDHRALEQALVAAVKRGVRVRALIAHTSHGGERMLRALEMRLLKEGVTVCRTAGDLVRYHGKMMIVDNSQLYLLGFNFTHMDMERSRSFGVKIEDPKLVEEAMKLFEADSTRAPYEPKDSRFVVSPANARKALAEFLKGASKELLIYDPNISDKEMAVILQERAKAGVSVRVIGCSRRMAARRLISPHLHVRLAVRDESSFFLGSQSLRAMELEKRREMGVILDDPKLAVKIKDVFEQDWNVSKPERDAQVSVPAKKIAKKVAKALAGELPPLAPALQEAIKQVSGPGADLTISEELEDSLKDAVRQAVKDVVREAVEEKTA